MTAPNDIIIRVSSLPGWTDCNRRSAARIFRKDINDAGYKLRELPRSIAGAVGSAVHKAAAVMLSEKANSGSLPPANIGEDASADSLREQIADGVTYDGPKGITRSRDDAFYQGARLSRAYHSEVAPHVEPILIEERLEAEVRPGLILSGQPDLVAREPGQIRDLKTGSRLGNYAAQAGGYSLLARTPTADRPTGIDIEKASIDFLQRVRPDKPQPSALIQPIPLEAAESAAVNILRHIEEDIRIFRNGDPERGIRAGDPWAFQSNPNSMLCGDKYCPAHGTAFCRDWLPKPIKE